MLHNELIFHLMQKLLLILQIFVCFFSKQHEMFLIQRQNLVIEVFNKKTHTKTRN